MSARRRGWGRGRGRGKRTADGERGEADDILDRPRVVLVTRVSAYEQLLTQHGTRAQASFFLGSRGRDLAELDERERVGEAARREVMAQIPETWRQARVDREDLHRFVFEPADIVVALGPDGLVANVAKYLDGQPVIGVDSDPGHNAGVLVPHRARDTGELLRATARRRASVQRRTMVDVELDDGQRLTALNELFVGHPRHQSARYRIGHGGAWERHSSSGVVVSTGTGATGWASSINRARVKAQCLALPGPEERRLAFFVREAWPSPMTQTGLTCGLIGGTDSLELISEHDEGVIFGDGIEADRLGFHWGVRAQIRPSTRALSLVS